MTLRFLLFTSLILQGCIAPPVTKNKTSEDEAKQNTVDGQEAGLEDYIVYHAYLKEVVDALESDPQFRDKLEKAKESDIRSGKIAHELEFVSHKVRSRLDEIKRVELERLRHFAKQQYDLEHGLNESHGKVGPLHADKEHLDHSNPHTFEIEDLKKLIAKSTKDLAEADRKRKEEFKAYEMQKKFETEQKLKSLDDVHKAELEKQLKEREEKHKKHEPLHHPGSKQQLEEVWEKQDNMEQQDFDPKTFFMLHDLDGNGVWDENEVKTLFIKELDKMYQEGAPEDDMRERIEEMERMREHVFSEVDLNKDGLISYEEFIEQTRKQDFQEDKGWETIDQQKTYTEEEYRQFEKQRLQEVERLIAQGMLPPQPGMPYHDPRMPPGQFPPQGVHPGQVPQGYPQGQVPQGYPQGQVPQGYPQGQVPQGYPQGQYQQQVPPQYHPGQVPPQGQPQGGQISQQQMNNVPPNQIRQGNQVGQGQLPALNINEVYPHQQQQQAQNQQQKQVNQQQNQIPQQQNTIPQQQQPNQHQNPPQQASSQQPAKNNPPPQVNQV